MIPHMYCNDLKHLTKNLFYFSLTYEKWFVDSGNLFHLQIIAKSHFLVTGYGLEAGVNTGETKIAAPWLVKDTK